MAGNELELGDPYEPPRSNTDPGEPLVPGNVDLYVASTGQRFLNLILDTVFIYAATFALFFLMGHIAATAGHGAGFAEFVEKVPDLVLGVVLSFLYYVPQEAIAGRTLAKRITGTRVVSADGSPVTVSKVFGRTASRLIPFEAFSFLGGGGHPVGLHDRLPGTRVISTRIRPLDDDEVSS